MTALIVMLHLLLGASLARETDGKMIEKLSFGNVGEALKERIRSSFDDSGPTFQLVVGFEG